MVRTLATVPPKMSFSRARRFRFGARLAELEDTRWTSIRGGNQGLWRNPGPRIRWTCYASGTTTVFSGRRQPRVRTTIILCQPVAHGTFCVLFERPRARRRSPFGGYEFGTGEAAIGVEIALAGRLHHAVGERRGRRFAVPAAGAPPGIEIIAQRLLVETRL